MQNRPRAPCRHPVAAQQGLQAELRSSYRASPQWNCSTVTVDFDYLCLQAWGEGETDKVTISTTRAVLPAMPLISGISPSPPSCESHTYNLVPTKGGTPRACHSMSVSMYLFSFEDEPVSWWHYKSIVDIKAACFGVLPLLNLTVFLPLLHRSDSPFSVPVED